MINRRLRYIVRDQQPLLMQAADTVQNACEAMRVKHVGSVLVVDEHQRLLGIFTGRDAVKLLAKGKGGRTALANAMTPNPVTLIPEQQAIDALRAMSDGGFRHVPVVEKGRIVGIVSRADFKSEELDRLEEEEALAERIW
ncbi:signal transduction protein with CBS domains [Hyphomicrobium denitrificans 1NES1]|uniref:Signal transduction protein with CBS domains n=1 Tax=Hyphomicrobium denitrificans 1NES1 TaxID=670307 RepID=N0B3U8_9HYPH|nr:CBS domain-containing protein [Hyphomicrobium denitrificans]AGK56872.1 signal transduction protein with CBS domains [Hyphomicrobium denitrificans 1NES1]